MRLKKKSPAFRGRSVPARKSGGQAGGGSGMAVVLGQAVICTLALGAIFTMRFVNAEGFELAGEYYGAVTGEDTAVSAGAMGEPIDDEKVGDKLLGLWKRFFGRDAEPQTEEQSGSSGAEGSGEASDGGGSEREGDEELLPANLFAGEYTPPGVVQQPVEGVVTSGFGVRDDPITGEREFHDGIDIAADEGSSIFAILDGQVAEVTQTASFGNAIRLVHADGWETLYCHCSAILAQEGTVIRAGERIAEVGSTGNSTGPHLHLTVMIDGMYADPLKALGL